MSDQPASPPAGSRVPDAPPSPLARVSRWDWLAFLAALALMLTMSMDWYTTKQGQEDRRIQHNDNPSGVEQIQPSVSERAAQSAEHYEKNAWQADAAVDRLILVTLLVAFGAAAAAAFLRAAGRHVVPNPSAIASLAGLLGALLIVYRMLQKPGLDAASVLKAGAPLSLLAVGILAFAARASVLADRERAASPLS